MRYIGTLSRREEKNKVHTFLSLSLSLDAFDREVSSTSDMGWCVDEDTHFSTDSIVRIEKKNMFSLLVTITPLKTADSWHESKNQTCAQHNASSDRERFI